MGILPEKGAFALGHALRPKNFKTNRALVA
jgi:hypothetical protein